MSERLDRARRRSRRIGEEFGRDGEAGTIPLRLLDEGRWQRRLDDEVRPLVDSLRRLRDRGLLD